jgi:hypothetical protein
MWSNLDVGRYARRTYARREGLRRISFGIFPMVMYTGYAALFPNIVSWVLSEERRIGMIVAPGFSFSTST